MVSSTRLAENFAHLAAIGAQPDGGITRQAFSDADWQARDYIIGLMHEAGLTVRSDAFGNVFGRREGTEAAAPVVMLGSHLDSVPAGGNFDGVLGVLAAIEVVRCLQAAGIQTRQPIEVVVFMAEESSRFGMATLGSKAFCGKLSPEQLASLRDKTGITLAEAMRQRGLYAEQVAAARYPGTIKAFLELHIEQGRVLESAGEQIGIITGIAAPTRLKVSIAGQADHSGATPMHLRQDALTAAAEIILLVEQLANQAAADGTVGTTGMIAAEPGVMNVIPGRVELGIDIRSIDAGSKQQVVQQLQAGITAIAARRRLSAAVRIITDDKPVQISREMVEFLHAVAREEGYACRLMPSGAGHDAMHVAGLAPAGLLFIPCKDGVSHNAAEYAAMADIVAGTQLLLAAVTKLAVAVDNFQVSD